MDKHIAALLRAGTKKFICGGARGFDTMAALAVLHARERENNALLSLAIPYHGMDERFRGEERELYQKILSAADEVNYIAEKFERGCMLRRDRYMVDRSGICICYLTKTTGGTAYTVAYAIKNGLEVINLDMEV